MMEPAGENFNDGVRLLNWPEAEAQREQFTVVVSGLGRSGTTMVSKMLSHGGIPMGVAKSNVIHEDIGLSAAIENKDKPKVAEIVERRNERHKVWGIKRPLIVKHSNLIEQTFRFPRYIILFRDPLAVASRNSLSLGFQIKQALDVYAGQNQVILDFLGRTKRPLMLVSYEKAIADPASFAAKLGDFCRLGSGAQLRMVEAIRPNDPDYRQATKKRE